MAVGSHRISLLPYKRCLTPFFMGVTYFLCGCSNLLFVSDRDGTNQIYEMTLPGSAVEVISHSDIDADSYPDVSPDAQKFAYSSARTGQQVIATRDISDTVGATEDVLQASSTATLLRPRWSCQQDLISYAERTPSQDDTRIMVVRVDGGSSPFQVAAPGSYAGHDWILDGNWIVYSSRIGVGPADYGLSIARSDGSGAVLGPILRGELPTTSHDGALLAFVQRVALGAGWPERIYIVDSRTFETQQDFSIQPPIGGRKIAALGFSGDDSKLYVATEVADVPASDRRKRIELFSVKLDGTELTRLTENTDYDSLPDGIPNDPAPVCRRCAEIRAEPETSPTQTLTVNGVVFRGATLPNGSPTPIAITDYCPQNNGVRELKVGWSESATGAAEFAVIEFPNNVFGDGPSNVEVTACHYSRLRLMAYDQGGNLVADVSHTAGQNQLETMRLGGGPISRIQIMGAEIGIRDVCYTP